MGVSVNYILSGTKFVSLRLRGCTRHVCLDNIMLCISCQPKKLGDFTKKNWIF
jgi:hypothetical protein